MTVDTQNHIRDSITLAGTGLTGIAAWGDKISAIPGLPPTWPHYWPFILLGTLVLRAGSGMALRFYNIWYPPTSSK